ncbi:MerR family transcriptional regulator [Bombilactobacillus thymidiniphilus]|uniref:MerR family transcriptional regulator n=1 Tax=Bombilactobacillus thymidiniphilus TaxID=2923363 RepID=A0ABY4PCJ9_9LACO|nr:MerR family transcriptional regulator [Bombilactobacillus thymidiniphilus]UQS83393.1 MerR family transcriptional regulator [Bombilactobacillus thymidiniphilus]
MSEKELRRNLAVLTVSTTIKLTGLTARQLRYYESFSLVQPQRSAGNQRLYSLNDIDCLLEIKSYLSSGMTMEEVKRVLTSGKSTNLVNDSTVSDSQARKIFRKEMLRIGQWGNNHDSNNLF